MSAAVLLKFWVVGEIDVASDFSVYALTVVAIMLTMAAMLIYMLNSRQSLVYSSKLLHAMCSAVAVSYVINIYFSMISVYAMPVALAAFMIAPLSKRRDAFVGNLFCNILVFSTGIVEIYYGASTPILGLLVMSTVGIAIGTFVSYIISITAYRKDFVAKGVILGAIFMCLVAIFTLCQDNFIFGSEEFGAQLLELIGMLSIASFAPIFIGLLCQPMFEYAFNLVTNSRLVEFTDHNSPLIKRLITEAPGTFNHSLAVANFAEMCAGAIGENPYLARACAYYHDIGKLTNPEYYRENQSEINHHDALLPEVSAEIIRKHTDSGFELCKKYRVPYEISHVTVQHHGTLIIHLFYQKAKSLTDSPVDEYEYSYHGVKPQTKVAAIIMLCDAGEAAIRAMTAPNGEKVDAVLSSLIMDRISSGQFDDCDLSLSDLNKIKQTIIMAFGGQFHKRIKYTTDGDN